MTENLYITNTPIFDQLLKEHPLYAVLSPHSSLRSSFMTVPYPEKPVLPVREPGATLVENEPQEAAELYYPRVGDEIIVQTLGGQSFVKRDGGLVITKIADNGHTSDEEPEIDTIEDNPAFVDAVVGFSDSLMFHGVTAEDALENASHFPGYVATENPNIFARKVSGL